jgi:transposase InsO family protein
VHGRDLPNGLLNKVKGLGEGWSYLAVLLDLYSRRVVGWPMSSTNDTDLALAALQRAVRGRHLVPPGLVHHTDRGSLTRAATIARRSSRTPWSRA